jgi:hypothetical protein
MRLPFEFAKKKLLISALVCYLSVFVVNSIKKIIMFYFFGGDTVTMLYQFLSRFNMQDVLPLKFFIAGSFALSFLYPVSIIFVLIVYGMVIQTLLLVFCRRNTPSRFSINLGLIFYSLAHSYLFLLLPFIGGLLYPCFFIYILSKELAAENSISFSKGVLLLCAPLLLLFLIFAGTAIAVAGIASSLL